MTQNTLLIILPLIWKNSSSRNSSDTELPAMRIGKFSVDPVYQESNVAGSLTHLITAHKKVKRPEREACHCRVET